MKRLFFIFFLSISGLLYPFGKNKVIYTSYKWKIIETEHFRLYVPSEILFLSNRLVLMAEGIYDKHSKTYDYKPAKKIKVLIFPDNIDFMQNNVLDWTSSQIKGFTEFLKGRVVIYYSPDQNEFWHIFAHELNHAFQGYLWGRGEANVYSIRDIDVPLWFVEGASEFNSIGLDEECENYISEALYNSYLPSLMELSDLYNLKRNSYAFIYKEGQIFYYFLSNQYGEETVRKITKDIVETRNFNLSLKRVLNRELNELNEEFFAFLKKRYYGRYNELLSLETKAKRIIKTDSSYNISPVAIDNNSIAFITDRKLYPSIVVYDRAKNRLKKIVSSWKNEDFLEFFYDDDNHIGISTNQKIAFTIRSKNKSQIYIYDLKKKKFNKIELPFKVVRSVDISADGRKILFSADNLHYKSDIYIYDIEKDIIVNLTEDSFLDREPRFLDENSVVFISDRMGKKALYFFDLTEKKIKKYLDVGSNVANPSVSKDGKKIVFVSKEAFQSLYIFDLSNGKLYKEFSPVGSVVTPSFSEEGNLILSYYRNGSYNIYEYVPEYRNVYDKFTYGDFVYTEKEEEELGENLNFKVSDYNVELSMDYLIGGLAVNSLLGMAAIGMTGWSDTLGDHKYFLWLDTGMYFSSTSLNNVNIDLSYMYLKYRHNLGFRAFHYSNYFYEFYTFHNFFEMERPYFTTYGLYGLYSYPFTTFERFDLTIGFRNFNFIKSYRFNEKEGQYEYELYSRLKNTITLDFVHDSTLNDITGPVDGQRFLISLEQAVSFLENDLSYTRGVLDYRRYFLIFPGYSLAFRANGGKIVGRDKDSYPFYVGGFNSIRGYDLFSFSGDTMFLFNLEFRFPLLPEWSIGFPFPIRMPTIWGSIFFDAGSAFNWGNDFRFYEVKDEIFYFRDLKCGLGFGLRLVIQQGIKLFYDLATSYDGSGVPDISKWYSFWFIGIDF
ncbi:MAG: BamA/TamA family outer membrane protein [Brevinematia bacterium]